MTSPSWFCLSPVRAPRFIHSYNWSGFERCPTSWKLCWPKILCSHRWEQTQETQARSCLLRSHHHLGPSPLSGIFSRLEPRDLVAFQCLKVGPSRCLCSLYWRSESRWCRHSCSFLPSLESRSSRVSVDCSYLFCFLHRVIGTLSSLRLTLIFPLAPPFSTVSDCPSWQRTPKVLFAR